MLDAVVTQPPQGNHTPIWRAMFTQMKPGAYLLCITQPPSHRHATHIEDCGFEIRDSLMYLMHNGFQTIIMARKPLDGTVVQNVLKWGVGGINIDACRVAMSVNDRSAYEDKRHSFAGVTGEKCGDTFKKNASPLLSPNELIGRSTLGRWPANVMHDGSDEVLDAFAEYGDRQAGHFPASQNTKSWKMSSMGKELAPERHTDAGSAARFFKTLKTQDELIEYLTTLVVPNGCTAYDPFR